VHLGVSEQWDLDIHTHSIQWHKQVFTVKKAVLKTEDEKVTRWWPLKQQHLSWVMLQ